MITKYRKQPKGKVSLACGRQPPRWPPITLFFFNCIGVQLIHSGMLVSGVQQSGWAIYTFTIFFFILVYYRILNIVPCAIQQDLVVYPSYIYQFKSVTIKWFQTHIVIILVGAKVITFQTLNFNHCNQKAMAPHSSTLAWKIPRTEKLGGLQSMGSLRVGHN